MKFLNEKQVAEILGISVKTLQRWRLFGEGPPGRNSPRPFDILTTGCRGGSRTRRMEAMHKKVQPKTDEPADKEQAISGFRLKCQHASPNEL